jgi:hypothetical protein
MIIANTFLIGNQEGKLHLSYRNKCQVKFIWHRIDTGGGLF